MSLEGDIELLGRVPLFSDLTPDNLRLLAISSIRRDLMACEMLFSKGEPARSGFVVSYGVIELATGLGGQGGVRQRCNRGFLIGEVPLFVETTRPADARATTVSTVMEISGQIMHRMLHEYPEAARSLHARMATRLDKTIADLEGVRGALLAIDG